MQNNKNYVREIELKDLFFDLLYRWRSILIAALIGAVLLGAFQYIKIETTHKAGKQTAEEKQFEIDLQDYRDSIKNTRLSIRTLNQLMKEKSDYLDESVYMQLDSQNEWLAYKRFFIKMDQAVLDALPESAQEDPADYVAAVYTSTLKTGLDEEAMEELLGTGKIEYINELVAAWPDNGSNTVTVQVIGKDAETVEKQLDYFVDRLQTYCAPRAQEIGAHTLTPVNEDTYSRTDADLSTKQDAINQQLVEWQEALKEQRETLNQLEEKKEPKAPGKHLIRYAAIGFILGAFLLAGIYAVKYVMGGKLHAARELSKRFGLPVFGEYAKSRARRPGKGLDKLFEKWEFMHVNTDAEALSDSIAALINEKYAGKRVLLTGTLPQAALDNLRNRLLAASSQLNLDVQADFLNNPEAISAAGNADAVVLVEEKYASAARDIEREAEMLVIGSANVDGCIVV